MSSLLELGGWCPEFFHPCETRRANPTVLLRLNLPNLITLSRIPLMFVIVGLMYCEWLGAPSLAFWLFIACAIGDGLDGYIARKRGLVSTFGKLMDALTDKIMVVGLVIALVDKHEIPVALALITMSRE